MIYHDLITIDMKSVEYNDPLDGLEDGSLEAYLGIRRDGREQADSARSILLTLLGELVRPAGRSAWTQSMIAALGLFGVEPQAARLAISRLAERGWLVGTRIGRRTRWGFTPELDKLLDEGAARIYGFGPEDRRWDGQWLLLLVSVPEHQRRLRSTMAVRLGWAGFGSLAKGVWVSPWTNREPEAVGLTRELGIEGALSFLTTSGSPSDRDGIVERSWDLHSLSAQYERFLYRFRGEAPGESAEATAGLLSLVHDWRRFPILDPGLPTELLPAGWPAADAASRFSELRSSWQPAAMDWWKRTYVGI